jgi:hypothetical protein
MRTAAFKIMDLRIVNKFSAQQLSEQTDHPREARSGWLCFSISPQAVPPREVRRSVAARGSRSRFGSAVASSGWNPAATSGVRAERSPPFVPHTRGRCHHNLVCFAKGNTAQICPPEYARHLSGGNKTDHLPEAAKAVRSDPKHLFR